MIDENNSMYDDTLTSGTGAKITKYALAILSGVPFIGNVVGAGNSTWNEYQQEKFKKLLASWLKLQEDEIKEIGKTLMEVMERINTEDAEIQKRIESPEYLSLIKKCFRDWSAAESEEKRILIRNLLSNAAGGEKICGDDVIRLFVEWIDRYSEGHFSIIKTIYKNNGFTRQEIWNCIHGKAVREDSAEADLFRLLIHDLSLGRIIRQYRERDFQGNFLKSMQRKSKNKNPYMASAFDDSKQYELTELGRWFVHYTMNELVPKIADKANVN
ncbi:MAG: hypothetical protein GY730_00725 [bacterium]|nr:hypothetical protein [bacterium]